MLKYIILVVVVGLALFLLLPTAAAVWAFFYGKRHAYRFLKPNPRDVQTVNVDPLNDPNSPLAKRSIYFDFDSYSVKDDYQSLLQQHAQYLKSHPQRHVLIQGNTDERGTSEYNLALGQKRAEAVRRSLSLMGVTDSQMEAVSLGKEKPQATGHDESSWAQNRRADLVYQQ